MGLLLRVAELLGQPGGQQLAEQGYLDRMWAADQETVREPGEARLLGVRPPPIELSLGSLTWPSLTECFKPTQSSSPMAHYI